eukprot:gnl/Spiro4/7720_TR4061_c0_g1_i1.p1 gnl/Spiro4/7720_TR4061_c0_g1~~gnl/Spiro4/7720_TR4061_c0_g1_i1.p1  ORF type:complete len:588 (+),score=125.14 gnl/Spiro4/7720_TR4061_c0_g1_i1:138-1766(+)
MARDLTRGIFNGFWLVQLWVFVLSLTILDVDAAHVFKAFRMIQYDRGQQTFGSRRTNVNLLASPLEKILQLGRRILVFPFESVNLEETLAAIHSNHAAGVLILLPENARTTPPPQSALEKWIPLERALMHSDIPVPVYFAFLDDELRGMLEEVQSDSPGQDGYQIISSVSEASAVPSPELHSFQSVIPGVGVEGETLRTIGIFTHYDSFGIVPDLATGAASNAGGVIVLLELARMFSRLSAGFRTQGKYNLLFVLTEDQLNFAGVKSWLDSADARLLESMEFALCLDQLGTGGALSLHISKPPKDPLVEQFYAELQRRAVAASAQFSISHKKINISSSQIPWAHEQFSRKKIIAATLSSSPYSPHTDSAPLSSLFDSTLDVPQLTNQIKIIAEALAAHVYKLHGKNLELFSDTDVNLHSVEAWSHTLSSMPRVAPFLPAKHHLFEWIRRALQDHSGSEVTEHVSHLDKSLVFYAIPSSELGVGVALSMYRVKSMWFDVFFALAVVVYCFALFLFLRGTGGAMHSIKEFFRAENEKKNRRARD